MSGSRTDGGHRWGDGEQAVAIVGMACRVPGARDLPQFEALLREGRSGIRRFTPAELIAGGVDPGLAAQPDYVPCKGWLEDADAFDAAFFGVAPGEAVSMDPQHRHLIELCWLALEDAALAADRLPGLGGLYAGASLNTYWLHRASRAGRDGERAAAGMDQIALLDKDFLAPRVAYHLGLGGPAITVQTACSTSLVAVHLACQGLLAGDCDVALAGGVSISAPRVQGYLYQPGGIASPDGLCRPFDIRAGGTLKGDGAGVVVMRRLQDALADGDPIRAVIRGSAVSSDGRERLGFAAPGQNGQTRALRAALEISGADPAAVGLIETHGTGTDVGDEIELASLARAYGRIRGFSWLGSVKSNVGHLDAAAGVVGLIKAILALERGEVPPTLNHDTPKPSLAALQGRFAVPRERAAWPHAGERVAAVSSFGLGGTNAHVVLSQSPRREADDDIPPTRGSPRLVVLSARDEASLDRIAMRLAEWMHANADASLDAIARTLLEGRQALAVRRAVICRDRHELLDALQHGRWFEPGTVTRAGADALRWQGSDAQVHDAAVAWLAGAAITAPEARACPTPPVTRLALPGYPLQRRRYWFDESSPAPSHVPAPEAQAPAARSVMWQPTWMRLPAQRRGPPLRHVLLWGDRQGVAETLQARLLSAGVAVTRVDPRLGLAAGRADELASIEADADALAAHWEAQPEPAGPRPDLLLIACTLDASGGATPAHDVPAAATLGAVTGAALRVARLLGALSLHADVQAAGGPALLWATRRACVVDADDPPVAETVGVPVLAGTLAMEWPGLRSRVIDLPDGLPPDAAAQVLLEQALALGGLPSDPADDRSGGAGGASLPGDGGDCLAWRRGHAWVRDWMDCPIDPGSPSKAGPACPEGACYLITGGMGGVGLALARHLAALHARHRRSGGTAAPGSGPHFVLVGRRPAPDVDRWPAEAPALAELVALGARVTCLQADLSEPGGAARLGRQVLLGMERLEGVIHAVGEAGGGLLAVQRPDAMIRSALARGAAIGELLTTLARRPPRWTMLCGSHAGVWGGFGQGAYALANATLESVTGSRIVHVAWDRWQGVGMAARLEAEHRARTGHDLAGGLPLDRMLAAFDAIIGPISAGEPAAGHWLVSGRSPAVLREERRATLRLALGVDASTPVQTGGSASRVPRPAHLPEPVAPSSVLETRLLALWENRLGIAPLGVRDDFFELGGDSLIALGLVGLIRRELGTVVPLEALLRGRTVEGLAARLGERSTPASTAPESGPAGRTGTVAPARDGDFEEGAL